MKREKDGAALVTCEHNKCRFGCKSDTPTLWLIVADNVDADMKL